MSNMNINDLFNEFVLEGQEELAQELQECLDIDQSNINQVCVDHSRLFSKYTNAHEMASYKEATLKDELERLYARLDCSTREQLDAHGKKFTEKMVYNTVITSDAYRELKSEYEKAKLQTGLLKAAMNAMIHRKDMIVAVSANFRAEGNSGISLNMR